MNADLPLDIQRQLNAAEGWLGLGDHLSANDELEQIPAALRAHPLVLLMRYEVYSHVKRWEVCVDIANSVVASAPQVPEGWIKRSFALHELKRTTEAYDLLLPVADKFSEQWFIPYNLACYCCQLGRCEKAEKWFKRAMGIDENSVKASAIDDPDLEPLWQSKEGMKWQRTSNEL